MPAIECSFYAAKCIAVLSTVRSAKYCPIDAAFIAAVDATNDAAVDAAIITAFGSAIFCTE